MDLAEKGTQLVATTHDRKLAASLVAENCPGDRVSHLVIHSVNANTGTIVLSPAVEEIDLRRKAFDDSPDSDAAAQAYASDLRVHLKARLGDLFDHAPHPAASAPTKAPSLRDDGQAEGPDHGRRPRDLLAPGRARLRRRPRTPRQVRSQAGGSWTRPITATGHP